MAMLASMTVTQGIVGALFMLVCILLILVVLVQKGRGGGLAGAFGGAGGHSAFGAKTGDVFTWVTIVLTAFFIGIAVVGNYAFVPQKVQGKQPTVQPAGTAGEGEGQAAPAEEAVPPAGAALATPPAATRPG